MANPLAGEKGFSQDEMITVQISKPCLSRKAKGSVIPRQNPRNLFQQCPKSKKGDRCYLEYRNTTETLALMKE